MGTHRIVCAKLSSFVARTGTDIDYFRCSMDELLHTTRHLRSVSTYGDLSNYVSIHVYTSKRLVDLIISSRLCASDVCNILGSATTKHFGYKGSQTYLQVSPTRRNRQHLGRYILCDTNAASIVIRDVRYRHNVITRSKCRDS